MNAKRLKKGTASSQESSAGVTVELPATTGPEAQRAICPGCIAIPDRKHFYQSGCS